MRFTFGVLASLLILSGCQTSGGRTQTGFAEGRETQYRVLINALDEVCVDNIGNADAIDKAARALAIGTPKTEESQIGFREVTATIYPIGAGGGFAGVIAQKEGESCAVITKQSIEFRKSIGGAFGLEMEDMGTSFDFGEVLDLQYGFSEIHRLPVKQYKIITDKGQLLDVVEFMTPNAFREESSIFGMVSGALAKRRANPDETASDIFSAVLDEVCLPHAGNVDAIRREAEQVAGSTGVQFDRPEDKLFADALQMYVLTAEPDGSGTFIGVSSDGGLCGYWAVDAKQANFDVFRSHDLMQVDSEILDDGLVELGFSPDENVAVLQIALQREGKQIYSVLVIDRASYSGLNFHDLPVLPWAL